MKIELKNLTCVGPSPHSAFRGIPFQPSSDAAGLLPRPVLALQTEDCIKIIGNIEQFEACNEKSIPAYVLTQADSLDMVRACISFYEPLHLVDKALLMAACQELGFPEQRRLAEILPLLGLPERRSTLDELGFIARMPDPLKDFIIEKDLSLKRIRSIQRAESILDWAVELLMQAKPGVNVFLEILQHLWEIHKRDDKPLAHVLDKLGLHDLEALRFDEDRSVLEFLRTTLRTERFPLLSEANAGLKAVVTALNPPLKIDLTWDPSFEEQGLILRCKLRHADDARELAGYLQQNVFVQLFESV